MRLHVLTACSRPENLTMLAESLSDASCAPWEVCWHVRLDPERQHVGGQQLKNDMLDQIDRDWVCFLDDDTTMHPFLIKVVAGVYEYSPANAVVVSQQRADGRILHAAAENIRVGEIDIGQVVLRRDLIGQERIPLHYEGDGMFLEKVLPKGRVVFVDEVLSWHNRLEAVAA